MYSTYNERKSVIAKRFIKTSKIKTYKYMTSVAKNVYIDKLDDIVNKYDNTYNIAIKMKPLDLKSNTYIGFNKEINRKDSKFGNGDIVRISKYKNIFSKSYTPNWSEEVFWLRKSKTMCRVHMLLMILKVKKSNVLWKGIAKHKSNSWI